MNETSFKNLEDIKNYKIRFKCFEDGRDGHQAIFYINDKINSEKYYKINFYISGTEYNSDITNSGKLWGVYIDEKYGDLENCFKKIGIKHIEERVLQNNLSDEPVSLIKNLK